MVTNFKKVLNTLVMKHANVFVRCSFA